MQYGLTKKLTFLLYESIYEENNEQLENDICNIIKQLQEEEWLDLYYNFDECKEVLQSLQDENGQFIYSQLNNIDDFIEYLEYLPVDIAENQIVRQTIREENTYAFIYENGYREFISSGLY